MPFCLQRCFEAQSNFMFVLGAEKVVGVVVGSREVIGVTNMRALTIVSMRTNLQGRGTCMSGHCLDGEGTSRLVRVVLQSTMQ